MTSVTAVHLSLTLKKTKWTKNQFTSTAVFFEFHFLLRSQTTLLWPNSSNGVSSQCIIFSTLSRRQSDWWCLFNRNDRLSWHFNFIAVPSPSISVCCNFVFEPLKNNQINFVYCSPSLSESLKKATTIISLQSNLSSLSFKMKFFYDEWVWKKINVHFKVELTDWEPPPPVFSHIGCLCNVFIKGRL